MKHQIKNKRENKEIKKLKRQKYKIKDLIGVKKIKEWLYRNLTKILMNLLFFFISVNLSKLYS